MLTLIITIWAIMTLITATLLFYAVEYEGIKKGCGFTLGDLISNIIFGLVWPISFWVTLSEIHIFELIKKMFDWTFRIYIIKPKK